MASSSLPSVVVAGGGPSGLVAAILLGKQGIPTTVVEQSSRPDEWSTKSYSIVLGERGLAALDAAGCLSEAQEVGMKRNCIIFHDANGATRVIPKQNSESLGFSRPLLVACLEAVARNQPNVTIVKGAGVKSVISTKDKMLDVILQDDTTLHATHVVGADGKWSRVRLSFPETWNATIRTEPSFGVHIMVPSVPNGWRTDGTHVIQPGKDCMFYIIAAPIPTGELSVSMVCYDETLERYPWLAPAENRTPTATTRGWQDEYSARPANEECDTELADKLTSLLEAELPSFLKDIGRENLKTARINRRVSWVEINMSDVDDSAVCFATRNGRAVLIGDAAHAVTPTMGEGANLAMQSAVSLVNSLTKRDSEGAVPTIDELSAAFLKYGKSRPKEVEAVQQKSAAMCRFENARMRK